MPYPRTIRNFNAFVDGVSYFGRCAKAALPELSLATEDFRGGGMDAPVKVDMGMEAMEADLEFDEHSPALLKTFGARNRFVLRAAEMGEDDFDATPIVFTLGGRIVTQKSGDLGAGEKTTLTLKMAVDYFRGEHSGETCWEIDVLNGVRRIGGEDQLLSMRAAMAIS